MEPRIAVVIPTIRKDKEYNTFLEEWEHLFFKHDVLVVTVFDGDVPVVTSNEEPDSQTSSFMGEYADCIVNRTGAVRNLGFAYLAKYYPGEMDMILTLDDDVVPIGDPIQDHWDALQMRVPISWMSTASRYTRGFPYGVRDEAQVVLSHGIWEGVPDYDAPTQLANYTEDITFPKMPVPKGIYFPLCIMNVAFRPSLLPWMYQAPPIGHVDRMDDIFCGITCKRHLDEVGEAAVTGYARVRHQRASNVFENLKKEAHGIQINETFWKGDESHPYFAEYRAKLDHWQMFIKSCNA